MLFVFKVYVKIFVFRRMCLPSGQGHSVFSWMFIPSEQNGQSNVCKSLGNLLPRFDEIIFCRCCVVSSLMRVGTVLQLIWLAS